MNTRRSSQPKWRLLLTLAALTSVACGAAELRVIRPPADVNSPSVVWGPEREGSRAGMFVSGEQPIEVTVFLRLAPATNLPPSVGHAATDLNRSRGGVYFKPTNSLYVAMELRDQTGKILSSLKRRPPAPDEFPSAYSLRAVASSSHSLYSDYIGPNLPPKRFDGGALPPILLADYFQDLKPGKYELTVWPKVYKRPFVDSDIVNRVDLPPVKATIQWPSPLNN